MSSAEWHQERGRGWDLIDWLISEYEGFMADDDFSPYDFLARVIAELREKRQIYGLSTLAQEPRIPTEEQVEAMARAFCDEYFDGNAQIEDCPPHQQEAIRRATRAALSLLGKGEG